MGGWVGDFSFSFLFHLPERESLDVNCLGRDKNHGKRQRKIEKPQPKPTTLTKKESEMRKRKKLHVQR
jgi:hypothetical protein